VCIERGVHTAEDVQVTHPLQILGRPGSKLVCRKRKADTALAVHANVRLNGVHLDAQRSACIQHHSGRLHLACCRLQCDPQQFDHLYCALVTMARSTLQQRSADLIVEETVISGSLKACECQGDGQLRDVRMLFDGLHKRFWFSVMLQAKHHVEDSGAQSAEDVADGMRLTDAAALELAVQKSMAHKRRRLYSCA
jgi:hypothetical protein